MKIGMTYDLKTEYVFKSTDPKDANAEFDHPDTIQVIQEAIEAMGHSVVRIGSVQQLLERLDRLDVDLVFNIAEGAFGRNREAQVPILLEMKGIPFTGSDGLTQALTLDKLMTKKVLLSEGIPTPRFFDLHQPGDAIPQDVSFPLIVKPRFEGSSKGLTENSVVRSEKELREQARWVIETYRQSAIAEEFIRGNEFTVAVVGNETPEVYPVVRIQIDGKDELGDLFYTFSRIASGAQYLCPARIDAKLEKRLQELALRTYRAVECRDFGRIDFRVDASGNPFVLEINPLPSLSTEDVFGILAGHAGISYGAMIARIVDASIQRYGLGVQERARR
ncbi:MAG: ATP-grasp domain-containing protein [Candidatus Omnitrophica bacterium]|nr:ATP-grasp domain-containing protein [Candidatus Omnitrophota bacterium]